MVGNIMSSEINYGFMTLKALLVDYNQFKKSKLQAEIMKALKCDYKTAYDLGVTHCNMLSTWALLIAIEAYNKSYGVFFKDCLKKGYCNKEGYFSIDKPELFEKLGIKCKITKYDTIPEDLGPNQFYQIAVNGKHHFMASATADDGNIFLFDTNDRPYGAELIEALSVKGDRIDWLKRYE
jgi:hypothetical protein